MSKVRIGGNVEEGSTFAGKISWSGRFRIEVGCKSGGLDVDGSDDFMMIGKTHATILDEKIFRVLREGRSVHDTDSWCTVSLERSRICLRISEPGQVRAVVLDMFNSVVEGIVLGVCRVDCDLGLLDVTDDVEGSIGLADAEGDGELTTAVVRMYGEGSIGRGNEDWSISCVEGRSYL
jgi:hypothetical protein